MSRNSGDENSIFFRDDMWQFAISDTAVVKADSTGVSLSGNLNVTGTTILQTLSGAVLLSASAGSGGVAVTGNLRVTDSLLVDAESLLSGGAVVTGSLTVIEGRIAVDAESLLSGGAVVTGSLTVIEGDVDAVGGFKSQYMFHAPAVHQGEVEVCSASFQVSGSTWAKSVPMASAGSVLGMTVYSIDSAIIAGALTASVTIDGVQNSSVQLILTDDSGSVLTPIAKDTVAFSGAQKLGVVLTASADYESSLVDSGSFITSLFVEM